MDAIPQGDTAVLLGSGDVAIQMKTPLGTCYVGFVDEALGRRYLALSGLDSKDFSFELLRSVLPSWPDELKIKQAVVYFRTTDDLALHAKDRKNFPYDDFRVPLHAFEKKG